MRSSTRGDGRPGIVPPTTIKLNNRFSIFLPVAFLFAVESFPAELAPPRDSDPRMARGAARSFLFRCRIVNRSGPFSSKPFLTFF